MVSVLSEYTEQGYRVIALACRALPLADYKRLNCMKREEIEKDLEFLGLIILENRLKPQTEGVIKELKDARVKVVMITGKAGCKSFYNLENPSLKYFIIRALRSKNTFTQKLVSASNYFTCRFIRAEFSNQKSGVSGDNIQTAISVARECGIIDLGETVVDVSVVPGELKEYPKVYYTVSGAAAIQTKAKQLNYSKTEEELGLSAGPYKFALTGKAWELIRNELPELIPKIIVKGAIFARMTSDQKQQLVLELQQLGYYVGK